MIGCFIDAEAMLFNPFKIEASDDSNIATDNTLCRFLQNVEDVNKFIFDAKVFAQRQGVRLNALGLHPRKLEAAGRLFRQMDERFGFEECAPLNDDAQAQTLTDLLAAVFPEQVAVRPREGNGFYAGGFRVCGKSVTNVARDIRMDFLLGPVVEKFKKAADADQVTLKAISALSLSRSVTDHDASEMEVVFLCE